MALKDILVLVLDEQDTCALDAGAILAKRHRAHVDAVCMTVIQDRVYTDAVYSAQFANEIIASTRAEGAKHYAQIAAHAKRFSPPIDVLKAEAFFGALGESGAMRARYADLTVLRAPGEGNDVRSKLLEGVLFGAGRPLLVIPRGWQGDTIGNRPMIAWNASKESARALADAIPLITGAEQATVVTVDAKPSTFGHGDLPGADVAGHLARHDLSVELRNVDGLGRGVSKALMETAESLRADLIVMGGYGHARLQQIVFGGATRDLLTQSKTPLLLSH